MTSDTLQKSFNKPTQEEVTKFHVAANFADDATIMEFINKFSGAIDIKDSGGKTALIRAIESRDTEVVKLLLENGADINAKDDNDVTALMLAAINNLKDMVALLLESGADVDAKQCEGITSLTMALQNGRTEIAALLVEWPKEQKRLREERHAQWLKDTDFSGGLQKPIPAPRPFNFSRKV